MDDQTATRLAVEIRQPTAEECSAHAVVSVGDWVGYACWYPQTGGYHGKAVAVVDADGCVDVFVWHDGQFPFDGQCQECRVERVPVVLHHCDGRQFVLFGRFLRKIAEAT